MDEVTEQQAQLPELEEAAQATEQAPEAPPEPEEAAQEAEQAPAEDEGPVMELHELHAQLPELEEAAARAGLRIVRVFHPAAPAGIWQGTYGSAEHEAGKPGYQLSDGSKVSL